MRALHSLRGLRRCARAALGAAPRHTGGAQAPPSAPAPLWGFHKGPPVIVHKRGADLLHDPWFNKGTAFEQTERDRLGLRGLLPAGYQTMEEQIDLFLNDYRILERNPSHTPENPLELQKWRILNRLHDRNETLYYKILIDNIQEMAPIIYTPTVGLVCQKYSSLFRRPRGMYFSASDRGEFISMCHNWPAAQVDMIVVTDGSRILGLGDLGVQGIGIPVGKLDLYVAAAGINPNRVLPIMFDVGTNNPALLADPLYLGLKQQRLDGEEYQSLVDEFMDAIFTRWPNVILQFEDFQNKWAFKLLQRYRHTYRTFNDDVQGTAGVALAGLMNAVRAQGLPTSDLAKARIVVVGAGSAGLGVVRMIHQAMVKFLGGGEEAYHKAARNFYIIDKDGLISTERKEFDPDVVTFMRPAEEALKPGGVKEGTRLLDVVKTVKPHVLLGLSGVGRLFTPEVLAAMKHGEVKRPAIFPMSNPTKNSECTSEEVFSIIGPHAVFASGSPFPSVECEGGKTGVSNQGNNMFLFPGIGLGTLISGSRHISDNMLHRAAETLAQYISDEEVQRGVLYPQTRNIREITRDVAAAVVRSAMDEGLCDMHRSATLEHMASMDMEELRSYVSTRMWSPMYSPLIYDVDQRFRELQRPS